MSRIRPWGMRRIVVGLLALSVLPVSRGTLLAQAPEWPAPGDRVRISSPEATGEYLVTGAMSDALIVQEESETSSQFSVDMSSLFDLEVYEGTRSRVRGGLLGSLGGVVLGGALSAPCMLPHAGCDGFSTGQRVLAGVGLGAVAGIVLWGGREMWEEVRIPGRAAPVFASGVAEPGRSADEVITASEIREAEGQFRDAYELVRSRRTSWLTPRSSNTFGQAGGGGGRLPPAIIVNGAPYGEARRLSEFLLTEVERLEYLPGIDAQARYGPGYEGGAIVVVLR